MVAAVLAIAVIVTVVVSVSGGKKKKQSLQVVHGVIGSEKQPFFEDPAVKAASAKHGYDVEVDTAGSRQIATTRHNSSHRPRCTTARSSPTWF